MAEYLSAMQAGMYETYALVSRPLRRCPQTCRRLLGPGAPDR
jgi:hypothetical protein